MVIWSCSAGQCYITCYGRPGGCMCTEEAYPPYTCTCECLGGWLNPESSKNKDKIEQAINSARKNVDKVRFTIKTDNSLSEITKILRIFMEDVKLPESLQDKTVTVEIENKTIKEIIQQLGLTTS